MTQRMQHTTLESKKQAISGETTPKEALYSIRLTRGAEPGNWFKQSREEKQSSKLTFCDTRKATEHRYILTFLKAKSQFIWN